MKGTYYDGWNDYDSVKGEYGNSASFPQEEDVIYAGYSCEYYEGSAIVVFVKDGKIYENNDGHCSCNGLDIWSPEETDAPTLLMREGWPGLADAVTRYTLSPPAQ